MSSLKQICWWGDRKRQEGKDQAGRVGCLPRGTPGWGVCWGVLSGQGWVCESAAQGRV